MQPLCPAISNEPPPGVERGTVYRIAGERGPRLAAVISDHWSLYVGATEESTDHEEPDAERWSLAGRNILRMIVPDVHDLDARHFERIDEMRMIPKRLELLPETVRQAIQLNPHAVELTGRPDWDAELREAISDSGFPDSNAAGQFRLHTTAWAECHMRRDAVVRAFAGN